nr:MAG TPA: hypothetical protein [Crassvirales sp.]DAO31183.1 MAG TPA: hypothetical protein [Crassvirales sp.]
MKREEVKLILIRNLIIIHTLLINLLNQPILV